MSSNEILNAIQCAAEKDITNLKKNINNEITKRLEDITSNILKYKMKSVFERD